MAADAELGTDEQERASEFCIKQACDKKRVGASVPDQSQNRARIDANPRYLYGRVAFDIGIRLFIVTAIDFLIE